MELFRRLKKSFRSSAKADESWTRAILNSSYDAFIAIDQDGLIVDWNPQAEKTFGWSREEVLGQPLHLTIIPIHHRTAHITGMKNFLTTGKGPALNRRIEIDSVHRDGHSIPIELIIYPVRQGEKILFGAFLHDISERKRAALLQKIQLNVTSILSEAHSLDQAANRILEFVCGTLNWSHGEVWLIDPLNQLLKSNLTWENPALNLEPFSYETQQSFFAKNVGLPGRVWADGASVWVEDVTKDENFPRAEVAASVHLTSAMAVPLKVDNQIIGVMGFFLERQQKPDKEILSLIEDIGQRIGHFMVRRQAQADLAKANEELESRVKERTSDLGVVNEQLKNANRLKDEFLATVSHELRTPLNIIQGHSELLMEAKLNEEDRLSVEAIHRNAKAQGNIISDLLDVSRIISGKLRLDPKPVYLPKVIVAALESIRMASASKEIEVQVKIDEAVGPIFGDFDRLQQVVWNLLSNAVKFTNRHGRIKLELQRVNGKAQISVSDNGKGIEANFLPYVFERFRQEDSTTTRNFGGLGLGLAIARHITEAHGGTIEVSSGGKDQGASFIVSIPFLTGHETTEVLVPRMVREFSEGEIGSRLSGQSVLVVDDQEDTREMLKIVFSKVGASVRTADSSEAALNILKEQKFDLLVSDIGMPGEDGYSLIQKIRKSTSPDIREIPAIALTAYAREMDQAQALEAGFQLHLAKPIDPASLVNKAAKLLGSKK